MRVLVTGAGGFSGRRLVALLEARGDEVHTLGRASLSRPRHHMVRDVTDREKVREVVARVRPERTYHLAGVTHAAEVIDYYRVNVAFAAALLGALAAERLADRPILIVGTSAEYGQVDGRDLPIEETLQARPYGHYGISKLGQTVEGLAAARRGQAVVIVRPFNLIGPGMPPHLVVAAFARQLAAIAAGRQAPVVEVGNLDASRDFLHVDDAVAAYAGLLEADGARGRIVNVCSGTGVTVRKILDALIRLAGVTVEVRTRADLVKPIDIPAHYGSVARMRRLVGPTPFRDLDESLREILDTWPEEE